MGVVIKISRRCQEAQTNTTIVSEKDLSKWNILNILEKVTD